MKKIASIAVIALFAIAFTSCKKEYMCKCTFAKDNEQPFYQATGLGKATKDDAKAACEKQKGSIRGGQYEYTCELEEEKKF